MLVALLLYGYSRGIYSSRQLARACEERVDMMAVTGLNKPDFRTISVTDASAPPSGAVWRPGSFEVLDLGLRVVEWEMPVIVPCISTGTMAESIAGLR